MSVNLNGFLIYAQAETQLAPRKNKKNQALRSGASSWIMSFLNFMDCEEFHYVEHCHLFNFCFKVLLKCCFIGV